jgi:hypothetical protein
MQRTVHNDLDTISVGRYSDQVEVDEMDRARNTKQETSEVHPKFWWKYLKKIPRLRRRIILKWTLKKYDGKIWIGLSG